MSSPRRIDTHQHIVPPIYGELLASSWDNPGSVAVPEWSMDQARDVMGANGIETGILSISMPGVCFAEGVDAAVWARRLNEYSAEVVREDPKSFGMFAVLTLPDVDAALAEAAYALDVLGADGVVLLANHDGHYLGDPLFEPLMAELGRRGAVVFVHPNDLPAAPVPGVPPFAADFLLDTTRSAIQMASSGLLTRFPELKVILSHAGGFLPYMADRCAPVVGRGDPVAGKAELAKFYFDLAVSSGQSALPSLLNFADPTHITYGTDHPYAPLPAVTGMRAAYEAYDMAPQVRAAIDRTNAEALFPRLDRVPEPIS